MELNEMLGTDEQPDVDPARANLVAEWIDKVKKAKDDKRIKDAFKQMRENMDFAARGADKAWADSGKYVVPITNRHINLAVSQLYAKNPTAVAKPRRKMLYQLWDGKIDSLNAAMEMAAMGDPMSLQIIQEVSAAVQYKLMLKRMGHTSEILWDYYISEQALNFKKQLKAMVRRAKVAKVGYIKIGFQRIMEPNPEISSQIEDVTSKIRSIETTLEMIADGDLESESARLEELRLNLKDLQNQEMLVVREGVVFDFPKADEIIVDTACRHLSSFAGAGWIAHEFDMTAERIKEIYKVNVSATATRYRLDGQLFSPSTSSDEKACYKVWEIQDKRNKQCLTVCDGWKDFLKEPSEPYVKIDRFWTIFPLVFNETEHYEDIYSPSDVEQTRHIQMEYNRSRESLRQHRIAARPYYVSGGRLEDEDKARLSNHDDHEIIEIAGLDAGQKIEDLLQAGPTANIDPNLYETEMLFSDMLRVVGTQEANLGGVSNDGTATEASIAEQSRGASLADNVDDLDELLSEVARAFNQICLLELRKETVIEIVGPGAVWPDMPQTRTEVAKELMLEIKAGSSGRPNRAAELANLERGIPTLIQIPGVKPTPLAERYAELLDLPLEDVIAEGMPSITALNALVAKMGTGAGGQPTGDPRTDPNQQGAQGGSNAPGPQQNENEPGPQPLYPEPMVV